jgi:hypothetical protein
MGAGADTGGRDPVNVGTGKAGVGVRGRDEEGRLDAGARSHSQFFRPFVLSVRAGLRDPVLERLMRPLVQPAVTDPTHQAALLNALSQAGSQPPNR